MFAASKARALNVCDAFVAEVVFQDTEYGDELSVASSAPSTRNSTRETPTLSDALALIVVVPLTVEPFDGVLIDTVGGVVSLGGGGAVPPGVTVSVALRVDPL